MQCFFEVYNLPDYQYVWYEILTKEFKVKPSDIQTMMYIRGLKQGRFDINTLLVSLLVLIDKYVYERYPEICIEYFTPSGDEVLYIENIEIASMRNYIQAINKYKQNQLSKII